MQDKTGISRGTTKEPVTQVIRIGTKAAGIEEPVE